MRGAGEVAEGVEQVVETRRAAAHERVQHRQLGRHDVDLLLVATQSQLSILRL